MTNTIVAAIDDAEEAPPAPNDAELAKLPRNDTGNARRLIARHGHELAWVPELGWLAWDGKRWARENGDAAALERAQDTVDAIYAEVEAFPEFTEPEPDEGTPAWERWEKRRKSHYAQKGAHRKFAVAAGNGGKTKSMLEMAAPKLRRDQRDFDARHYHFNVANGTIRLDRGLQRDGAFELYPHRAGDRLTRMAEVAYDPKAKCPKWEAFMDTILPDPEVQVFFQKWLGYCLSGDISEQCFVMLDGKGSNGKSTALETVCRIIGDYSDVAPIESFLHDDNRSGSGPSPDLADLPGIRLIRTSEPEPGARLSESRIKQWTGGESIKARQLQKRFFKFLPTGKLTMSCNIRPRIAGKDEGIKTRVLVVPFKHRFARRDSGRKRDFIGEFVEGEGAGILNWLLDGYDMWRVEGLTPIPEVVRLATDDMFNEQDPIGQALRDVLVETQADESHLADSDPTKTKAQASAIVEACETWFKRAGEEVKTGTAIGRRMKEIGHRKKQIGGRIFYMGVSVNPEFVPAPSDEWKGR